MRKFLLFFICYLISPLSWAVSSYAETPQVKADLISSVDTVHPGGEILLGIRQQIIPHWHTYWLNPGDSGLPTTVSWSFPSGFTASDILWPVPSKISLGTVTNYGYSDDVTLLTKLTISKDVQPGETLRIGAVVDWLVCSEECIPQQVELSLDLVVAAAATPQGKINPLIEQARARLPVSNPFTTKLVQSEHNLEIQLPPIAELGEVKNIYFYPNEWGIISQNAEQIWRSSKTSTNLQLISGESVLQANQSLKGVLAITLQTPTGDKLTGYEINLIPQSANTPQADSFLAFFSALLLAFLGGLILNLMPCVFPVLSLKALSLVNSSNQSAQHIRNHGWVYTLGVTISFVALALLLIVLKIGGAQIGWGFQYQSPLFVAFTIYLLFLIGLNLSGFFVIGGSFTGAGSNLANKNGYAGSFFTGVLATLVATPCTAPFMAAALGYALTQPAAKLLSVFVALGLGLAFPYWLLAHWPGLHKRLPKPGRWMDVLKQLLAFPMYAASIWLIWVLEQQTGSDGLLAILLGILFVAFSMWVFSSTRYAAKKIERNGTYTCVVLLLATLFWTYNSLQQISHDAARKRDVGLTFSVEGGEAYNEERLNELLNKGQPVFLNFTAAWCISCKVNEKVALSSNSFKENLRRKNITYIKGDWTKRNQEITRFLDKFGRSGVPLYVYYPNGNLSDPIILPQILTPEIVTSTFN